MKTLVKILCLCLFSFSFGQDILSTHSNGQPKEIGTLKNGNYHGLVKTFSKDGQS